MRSFDDPNALPYTALSDAVVHIMRRAIVEGKFRPGERLLEVEIARQLGVSRAPVREATRQLASEGLLVTVPHRGTYVVTLSAKDAREIYGLRAALEGLAVVLVLRQGGEEVLADLDKVVERMRAYADRGDAAGLLQADYGFHETLCRAAHNDRLLTTWLSMNVQIRAFVSVTHLQYLDPQEIVQHHCVVLEAMRNGEAERAMWLLADDLMEAGEHVATGLAASQ